MESQVTFLVKVRKDNPETCIFQFDDEELIDSTGKFTTFVMKVTGRVARDWVEKGGNKLIDVKFANIFASLIKMIEPVISDRLFKYYFYSTLTEPKEILFDIKFNIHEDKISKNYDVLSECCELISSNITEDLLQSS